MNCQQFEARLNDLLDERAPLELNDALEGHVRGCAPCRGLWAAYGDMVQVMRFRSPPEPRTDLAERIVAAAVGERMGEPSRPSAGMAGPVVRHIVRHAGEVRHVGESLRDSHSRLGETRPRVAASGSWWRAAGIAAAAAVLLAVCWRFDPPSDHTASPAGGLAQGGPAAAEPRPLSELAQDAANCYAGLARETRSDLSDVLALVPRVDNTTAAALWNGGEPVPTPEVASHVRAGLRPLAQSTMAALTSLFGGSMPENGEL